MKRLAVRLSGTAATEALGAALAACLSPRPGFALLLDGPLGAGKTTLVRGLASVLPGGDEAEVASPSFNICNIYPTVPEVAHFDLYRLEGMSPGEEFHDALEHPETLVIVEWSQYLDGPDRPEDALSCELHAEGKGREAVLSAEGPRASACLEKLERVLLERNIPHTSHEEAE
ncbi:putative protein family UPF0079, ATPase [Desulfovibrio sp. X2]|uniref:tRNA (adenosine(37)-N6)-threonylcarbamoyltransferase complex ATPase subunit type 1 TsaE n=1 Tax=Desulfovibrio sp. X2 TaxID=941449 RepID=UPI00035873D7|nr:tRNA (adenosine(37)-N6)-threonylcarbamoyltransferase complex ATPase subunit type 1 TsaE [Desulfovibrio sp. X2]EPR42338.1 putative protein family UPF0079, ATPase [Desulfovibrio sp. X2]